MRLTRFHRFTSIALLGGTAGIAFIICYYPAVNLYDEGIILTGAMHVMAGDVIHRDFFSLYGPGQLYVVAFLFQLFSPSVSVERCADLLERSIAVVLVFLMVARIGSRWCAWFAALASIIWFAYLGFYGFPVFPAGAAALASLVVLVPVLNGSRSPVALTTAGLCAGLALLFRYDVGLAIFGAEFSVICLWSFLNARPGRRLRDSVRVGLGFGIGFGAIVLPLAVAYLLFGVIDHFIFDVVSIPAQNYVKMASLPFPAPLALLTSLVELGVYMPLTALAALLAVLVAERLRKMDGNPWPPVMLGAVLAVFFAKGFVRVSPIHMSMAIIASLALLAVLVDRVDRSRGHGRLAQTVVAGAVLVTTIATSDAAHRAWRQAGRNTSWLESGTVCRPPPGLARLGCSTIDEDHVHAIQYIEKRTAPDSSILSGLGRTDKVFVNDIAFYFLSDRRPATSWDEFAPGVQTTALIQGKMIAELRSNAPQFVVLESQWDQVMEPNGSAHSSGVTLLDDYIRRHYAPVAAFGPISILEMAPSPPGSYN